MYGSNSQHKHTQGFKKGPQPLFRLQHLLKHNFLRHQGTQRDHNLKPCTDSYHISYDLFSHELV